MDVFTPLIKPVLSRLMVETQLTLDAKCTKLPALNTSQLTSINEVFLSAISDFSENPMRDSHHVRNGINRTIITASRNESVSQPLQNPDLCKHDFQCHFDPAFRSLHNVNRPF